MPDLEDVFGELGISQYLDTFVEQGFDTWETILDITESDLDALGVKLGHRRKLQRRIANSRGLVPEISLSSPTRMSVDGPRVESHRSALGREEGKDVTTVVTKRKYRRHPKPDENAPERPPSAYVLFSNKMRDDLKGRNLTFTEIAKLVGENWQSLSPGEKEPFETAALKAKEKYNHDLAEYKKTPEYRKYSHYLHEFKQKQASQNQAKDASKRLKLETVARLHHHGSSTSATPASGTASGTASGSDSQGGSEPPPSRKRRVGSIVSAAESQLSSTASTAVSHHSPVDELMQSPPMQIDQEVDQAPAPLHALAPSAGLPGRGRRPLSWNDRRVNGETNAQPHLPSLSDMLGDGRILNGRAAQSPDRGAFSSFSPNTMPPIGPPPTLMHEHSSAGSTGSSTSSYNYPRTPSEPSLPIHALLTNKGPPTATPYEPQHSPFFSGPHLPALSEQKASVGFSRPNDVQHPPTLPGLAEGSGSMSGVQQASAVPAGQDQSGLDGMSALLKAGEIVGRRLP